MQVPFDVNIRIYNTDRFADGKSLLGLCTIVVYFEASPTSITPVVITVISTLEIVLSLKLNCSPFN